MSKKMLFVTSALLVLLVMAACGSPGPEPTPPPPPTAPLLPTAPPLPTPQPQPGPVSTPTPEATADDSWDRVESAGKIIVGTAADYPPFEYYTGVEEEGGPKLVGFDIELMDEISRRLGIEVEYRDFAFEGLGAAVTLGQIDAAIAAVSVTPEREALVDFTNVYYVGEDGILARTGSNISEIDEVDDLADLRIGAQRSTVYDDWLHTNLVQTGNLPDDQLFVYERAEDAVRDLRQDRLDLVMLDAQPAEAFAAKGGVKLVGQGLNQQRLAIALPKGSNSLRDRLNQVLIELQNEGFVAQLAREYLDLEPGPSPPGPTPTPMATNTPRPTSTPLPPPPCLDGLAFIQHLNYNDQDMTAPQKLQPGTPFTKAWRVQNTGTCTWDSGYRLVYGGGNDPAARMAGEPVAIQGQVAPGATYDIQIDLVAPLKPGTYQAFWQMENDGGQAPSPGSGQAFGERLPVGIRVPAPPKPTPVPTQTPAPGIIFTVDQTDIRSGECAVFGWRVENVREVYFYAEGERWQDNGVVGQGQQRECPPHTTTYYLRVVKLDGSVDTRQITINVEAAPEAPALERFTVDPPNQIAPGQCVDVRWKVSGNVNRIQITANGNSLWDNAPLKGQLQDCPSSLGQVGYGIEAWGPGGVSRGHQNIQVVGEATATPAPPPPPDRPVIHAFSVQPEVIGAGNCVNLRWQTGGGTSWVNIWRGEQMVWENAPLSGQVQDCPEGRGQIQYRLIAYNSQDKRVHQDQFVSVQ
jgi:polar amino acid transport system substrate-binding protein